MATLDSEHLLGSAVEAAMALLSTAGSAAAAVTDQHREGPNPVAIGTGPGTLRDGASSTHAPTPA
eukprot:4529002-Lingulodinium_polyedra.AAC.1